MAVDIIALAREIRAELESMAQEVPKDQKPNYVRWFPEFNVPEGGYKSGIVIRWNGELYENLLNGNIKSPGELSYAWRRIDPDATNLENF